MWVADQRRGWHEDQVEGIDESIMLCRWPSNTRPAHEAPLVDIKRRSRVIARCIPHAVHEQDCNVHDGRQIAKAAFVACHADSGRRACLQPLARGRCKRRPQHATSEIALRCADQGNAWQGSPCNNTPLDQRPITLPSSRTSAQRKEEPAVMALRHQQVTLRAMPAFGTMDFRPAILGRRYRISRGISETFPSGAAPSIPCATPCLPTR